MKQVYRYDENKFLLYADLVEDSYINDLEFTEIECPSGMDKPKFVNGKWIEGIE